MVTYYKVKAMLLRTLCLACGLCSVFSLGSLPEQGLSTLAFCLALGCLARWTYRASRRAEPRQAAAAPRLHTSPAAPQLMRTA